MSSITECGVCVAAHMLNMDHAEWTDPTVVEELNSEVLPKAASTLQYMLLPAVNELIISQRASRNMEKVSAGIRSEVLQKSRSKGKDNRARARQTSPDGAPDALKTDQLRTDAFWVQVKTTKCSIGMHPQRFDQWRCCHQNIHESTENKACKPVSVYCF